MINLNKLLIASVTVAGLVSSFAASAADTDAMECSVAVNFTSGAGSLTYAKVFEVSPAAPFSDDFSTLTRFKFFDATVAIESGIPVVSIFFDADVSVFNAVSFEASLKVRDQRTARQHPGTMGSTAQSPAQAAQTGRTTRWPASGQRTERSGPALPVRHRQFRPAAVATRNVARRFTQ